MNAGTRLTKSGAFASLRTLSDVVTSYQERFPNTSGHHDPVVAWCRAAPDFPTAIERACAGRREDGKMFSKGSCVRAASRIALRTVLLLKADRLRLAASFDDVYDEVAMVKPWGIGDMMVYNVAERIAAYLGQRPERYVYLHAGPRVGYRRLTGVTARRVARADLPRELRVLSVHDVEDLLCEYRDVLDQSFIRERERA